MKWDGSDTARVPVISTFAEKQGKLDPKKGRERRKETMEGGREEGKKEGMKEGINIIVTFYKAERLANSELVSTHTVKF